MRGILIKSLLMLSFVSSILILIVLAFSSRAMASDASSDKADTGLSVPSSTANLIVPVYPRASDEKASLPEGADLRDSYIIMEDGSALSVADWILGGLNKDKAGADMSDYESRLFLGQVARAAAGMDEQLVNRSLVNTRPTLSYKAPVKPGPAMQALESVVGLVVNTIIPGRPYDWDASKSGGAFNHLMKTGNTGTANFENFFEEAMMWTAQDFKTLGTMQIMAKEQGKKLQSESSE